MIGSASHAQTWCQPGATWHYGITSEYVNGFNKHTYTGDTLIDGFEVQRISMETGFYNSWTGQYFEPAFVQDEYTRSLDDGVVLVRRGGFFSEPRWDTLVWFGADVGDRWKLIEPEDVPCECWYTVTGIGTVEVDDVALRTIDVDLNCMPVTSFDTSFTFTERLGSPIEFFVSECWPSSTLRLRCYSDHEIAWTAPNGEACELINSIEERWSYALVPSPNPTTDQLTITPSIAIPSNGPARARILDTTGRLVHIWTGRMNMSGTIVDVSHLTPGLYTLLLKTDQGRLPATRFMKR